MKKKKDETVNCQCETSDDNLTDSHDYIDLNEK